MLFDYKDPLVLTLNVTVIIILTLLILPTMLSTKEKLGVRVSYSVIFLVVIINCIGNLILFYYQDVRFFDLHFLLLFIPFLFGPCIYFYIVLSNEGTVKNINYHFIIPVLIILFCFYHILLPDTKKAEIIQQVVTTQYIPYSILNTLIMGIPLYYFYISKKWLKNYKISPSDPLYLQKTTRKKWTNEFLNILMFSVFSFFIFVILATYFYKIPQPYLDLIGMPIYFPFIYAFVAVRSNMISKELEYQYALVKSENETKIREQRIAISRDLHDNIGAYANSLISKLEYLSSQNSNEKSELNDLKENAESILSLLHQTIWVLNNDEMSVESFYDYLKQYALKSFRHLPVEIEFQEKILNNKVIPTEISINLFRIFQEILQNIMKHSKATKIKITAESKNFFEIKVEDNGIGFNHEQKQEGFGIRNMIQRARKINYSIEIKSTRNSGTVIDLNENAL